MTLDPKTICVVANPGSGRNSRDAEAIKRAMAAFGPEVTLRRWRKGEDLDAFVQKAVADGFSTIVAAGGDGTVMGVAHALMGTGANLAVLPLGTFNYFARGLGLPQEPEAAAQAILAGHPNTISVGTVNGQVFLNNASIGIYPTILQAREDIYARLGRSRLMAHWSVLRTLVRFQRPRRMEITADGAQLVLKTPLVFVARSAYQLQRFGLEGTQAISDDKFVLFIARGGTRLHLLKLALRLALRRVQVGRDVELLTAHEIDIATAKRRPRVAFDGEKRRMLAPLSFRIAADALSIILPDAADRVEV
ncbi:diacylglycerol/lipid kinase family protein [Gemmobacter serpentinus]|uniref:diacylglycerol/lipid kinase family protein n=1 Tax=Gemmobacter serpentinus TaxID=2652247 RepID=UPI00124F13DD|nr:diacylglycerol kinase family protein [Gemmobacter serpentinus]